MINFRPFTLNEARRIIHFCRELINYELSSRNNEKNINILTEDLKNKLERTNYGVFVTIEKIVSSSMDGVYKRIVRGSIGALPSDEFNTLQLLRLAAPGAALKDPRRTPLHKNELGSCVLEVMFVSPGRIVHIDELHNHMIPGYHILVFDIDNCKRIIMPHELVEIAEEVLTDEEGSISIEELIDLLLRRYEIPRKSMVQIHETQIFYEVTPEGEVIERRLYLNKIFRRIAGKHSIILTQTPSRSR